MSKLFDITSINGMILNNRFVRSATWEGIAGDEGTPASGLIDMMIKLVKGGGRSYYYKSCICPEKWQGITMAVGYLQ